MKTLTSSNTLQDELHCSQEDGKRNKPLKYNPQCNFTIEVLSKDLAYKLFNIGWDGSNRGEESWNDLKEG